MLILRLHTVHKGNSALLSYKVVLQNIDLQSSTFFSSLCSNAEKSLPRNFIGFFAQNRRKSSPQFLTAFVAFYLTPRLKSSVIWHNSLG